MNSSDATGRDGDLLTRFSILILAGVFLTMEDIIPVDLRPLCFLVGVAGLLCYAALELVACRKNLAGNEGLGTNAEQRLSSVALVSSSA